MNTDISSKKSGETSNGKDYRYHHNTVVIEENTCLMLYKKDKFYYAGYVYPIFFILLLLIRGHSSKYAYSIKKIPDMSSIFWNLYFVRVISH